MDRDSRWFLAIFALWVLFCMGVALTIAFVAFHFLSKAW